MQNTKQKSGTKQKLTIAAIFGAMGPGLLAALSGNDAGGIATYSSAGASYGYGTLWMLPVMALLLIVVQETAARCGCVTGKGLASLIRERFGVRKSVLAMAALLIANTAVTISEFAGIASGLALFGVPASISVPLVALLVWMRATGIWFFLASWVTLITILWETVLMKRISRSGLPSLFFKPPEGLVNTLAEHL